MQFVGIVEKTPAAVFLRVCFSLRFLRLFRRTERDSAVGFYKLRRTDFTPLMVGVRLEGFSRMRGECVFSGVNASFVPLGLTRSPELRFQMYFIHPRRDIEL